MARIVGYTDDGRTCPMGTVSESTASRQVSLLMNVFSMILGGLGRCVERVSPRSAVSDPGQLQDPLVSGWHRRLYRSVEMRQSVGS